MSTAIVVTSGKGGTGKTSVTAGVAVCLAQRGSRVLCVDMDIGLRNLDLALGMSDRALMDFTDVIEGRCPLLRAAVSHPDIPNLSLLTAPLAPPTVEEEALRALVREAGEHFDFIFMDAPAGLGRGFRLASCAAQRALVVSTSDPTALRDAQRTVLALLDRVPTIHLVMNRVQTKLLRKMETNIDDAMDTAGLPLLGVIPEDQIVPLLAAKGDPLLLRYSKKAAVAYENIALRLCGTMVPIMRIR